MLNKGSPAGLTEEKASLPGLLALPQDGIWKNFSVFAVHEIFQNGSDENFSVVQESIN